jgi:CheY-like chemotaxis protein
VGSAALTHITGPELAQWCDVDVKTVRAWAVKGAFAHERTLGGHLRLRPLDALTFLRTLGLPLPRELLAFRPKVVVVENDVLLLGALGRVLNKRFRVVAQRDAVDAFVSLGEGDVDALVIDLSAKGIAVPRAIGRLRELPQLKSLRIFAVSSDPSHKEPATQAGATAFILRGEPSDLRDILEEKLLGPRPVAIAPASSVRLG